jgi:hypothetical protein
MRRAASVAVATLVAALLLMGPALFRPHVVLWGHPQSEAMGHLWRLEMVTDGLGRYGPFVTASDQVLFPDGLYADFADPVNLLFFAPVRWITGSSVLAWNALVLAWVGVSVAGSFALARRLVPDAPWAGPVLATSATLGAWWLGFDRAARTEYLPALLLPLHLAFLHDAFFAASRRGGVLAGLTLGGIALGGWYLTVFAGIVVAPAALAWAMAAPRERARRSLATVAGIAGLLVLPALASFLVSGREVLATQGSRALRPSVEVSVAGVASFFHQLRVPYPRWFFQGQDQPAYPGIVALIAATAGIWASPPEARRGALGWLALVAWILVWAAGVDLVLADDTGRVTHALPGLPRLLHAVVPVTSAITGWNRLGSLVGVPMGMALVTALAAPLARWPVARRAVPLLVLAMVADALTWPRPLELRAATLDPKAPAGLVAAASAVPEGALLLLPLDVPALGEGRLPMPPRHQHFVYWRRQLGRAITGGYGARPDSTMGESLLTEEALAVQQGRAASASAACVRADARALAVRGVAAVILVRSLPGAEPLEPALRAWLGPPQVENDGAVAWELASLGDDRPAGCPTVGRPPVR